MNRFLKCIFPVIFVLLVACVVFARTAESDLRHEIDGIKDRNVYVIEFKQKEAETGKDGKFRWNLQYAGNAWIDSETMEVVQINRDRTTRINFTGTIGKFAVHVSKKYYFTKYEYEKVNINDHFITLLVARTTELFKENGKLDTVYKYRYSDHKAFNVDTKIRYGAIE